MEMKQAQAFFKEVGKNLETPLVIALTGGVAASILADPRATDDIDFAILKASQVQRSWEEELQRMEKKHGVLLQFSEDIDRWSSVSLLDWRDHSRPWKKFGLLEVRILEPLYWSIGKITRGTRRDLSDLKSVLARQKVDWKKLVQLWAKALRNSPESSVLFNAKKQMEGFIKETGREIWGGTFSPEKALEAFHLALIPKKKGGSSKRTRP